MNSNADLWWVYLLECRGGRFYIGVSNNVVARFLAHARGKGAMFTRLNPPERIIAARPVGTKVEAMRAEYALKRTRRAAKFAWAEQWAWR